MKSKRFIAKPGAVTGMPGARSAVLKAINVPLPFAPTFSKLTSQSCPPCLPVPGGKRRAFGPLGLQQNAAICWGLLTESASLIDKGFGTHILEALPGTKQPNRQSLKLPVIVSGLITDGCQQVLAG